MEFGFEQVSDQLRAGFVEIARTCPKLVADLLARATWLLAS